jgi:hypothetical protein
LRVRSSFLLLIFSKETCTPELNTNNTCVLVNGQLTIFVIHESSAPDSSSLQVESYDVICKTMSDGELLYAHASILGLKCIDSNYTKSITDGDEINPSQTTVSSGVRFYNYIIGAAAFGVVLVALFVFVRRKITQKKAKDPVDQVAVVEDNIVDTSDAEQQAEINVSDDELAEEANSDAHNLLLSGDNLLVAGPTFSDVEDICSSPDSLEALEHTTIVDTYDFAPVLSSISSPRVLSSFAKSSYFPVSKLLLCLLHESLNCI